MHDAELAKEALAGLPPDVADSPLFNGDLAPVPARRRTWGTYNYAALWVSMSVNILTYMLAGGFVQGGMNWKQAVLTVLIGNTIVLAPILLNSHPGARYGVPFPVLARASFGVLGANVAALLRAMVACGWFGIQCWIGGEAINKESEIEVAALCAQLFRVGFQRRQLVFEQHLGFIEKAADQCRLAVVHGTASDEAQHVLALLGMEIGFDVTAGKFNEA